MKMMENRMFYLSVAPEFFDVIALNIKESGSRYNKRMETIDYRKTIWT